MALKRWVRGVLDLLGGLASVGHPIQLPASSHDVMHGETPRGPATISQRIVGMSRPVVCSS
jgi:hypothetical protein